MEKILGVGKGKECNDGGDSAGDSVRSNLEGDFERDLEGQ